MINYERVAEKIFSTIKGHGHDLIMFTEEGMETSDAQEARRFFVKQPNYMVTLDGEARHIKINKNSNVSLEDMESIMKQLKNLATANMLKTEIRVFGKEITPKDFAYQTKNMKGPAMKEAKEDWGKRGSIWDKEGRCRKCKHWPDGFDPRDETYGNMCEYCNGDGYDFDSMDMAWGAPASKGGRKITSTRLENIQEASFSRMHGFKKTSYQTLESTKIIVRHRRPIDEEVRGSRARNIQAIFIEHAGERFRFPHNNLAGARAMARHINEGGNIQDSVGQYIVESIANYNKLMEFVRYARTNKLINETSEDIIKTVRESVGVIRREIGQLQGAKTYGTMSETIQTRDPNVIEEDDTTDLQDMFTVRKFDEKIGDILPIVKKLMDNKQVWRNALVEASEKEIAISEKTELSETDVFEFDSPVQRMGYQVKDIASRMIGESDLQKFVGKVAGKLIEGEQISAFEKKVVGNVLGNAVIREEEEICEGCGELCESCKCGPKDVVELISDSYEMKMKMLEHEDIFTEGEGDTCIRCRKGTMEVGDTMYGPQERCNRCGYQHAVREADDHHAGEVEAGAHLGMPPMDDEEDCMTCGGWGLVSSTGKDWRDVEASDPDTMACPDCSIEDEDDGQPSEYDEWQDYMGGDDWDHGQFDESLNALRKAAGIAVKESNPEKAASGKCDPEDFMDDCPDCGGTGKAQDSIFDDDECLKCGGEGYV